MTAPDGTRAAKLDDVLSQDRVSIDLHGDGESWTCSKVRDSVLVSLLHDKVTSINVKWCSKLTDESIKAIAKACPGLKKFNVSGWFELTDESIKAIAQGCPELNALNISDCRITDESIKTIVKGCPGLKELSIVFCKKLTTESIKEVAKGCPELEKLQVVGWFRNLSEGSINAIAKGVP